MRSAAAAWSAFLVAVAAGLGYVLAVLPLAQAVTLVVDDRVDSTDGVCEPGAAPGSACNIRAGIEYCLAQGNATLTDLCVLELANGTHAVTEGQMEIANASVAISIAGQGMNETVVFGGLNNERSWLFVQGIDVRFALSSLSVVQFSGVLGGALTMRSTRNAMFTGVRFEDNAATQRGGAAYFLRSHNMTFRDSLWVGNSASFGGGCELDLCAGSTVWSNCTWAKNTAQYGGAVYLRNSGDIGGGISFVDSVWEDNRGSLNAGALFVDSSTNASFSSCTWQNNTSLLGGAVVMWQSTYWRLSNSSLKNNSAVNDGGALYTTEADHGSVVNCSWRGNSAAVGGALYADSSDFLVCTNCEWSANTAQLGGAMYLHRSAYFSFTGCDWRGNDASQDGGAMYLDTSVNGSFANSRWQNNTAVLGGANYLATASHCTFSVCTWENNRASEAGAIYSVLTANAKFDRCTWYRNAAQQLGGAFYVLPSTLEFSNSAWLENTAEKGGAVYFTTTFMGLYSNCSWQRNQARTDGGAMFLATTAGGSCTGCSFHNNTAGRFGGAVTLSLSSRATFSSCWFSNNFAGTAGCSVYMRVNQLCTFDATVFANTTCSQGAALYLNSDNIGTVVSNSTFANNHATDSGAGIYANQNNFNTQLVDSVAYGNTAVSDGAVIYLRSDNANVMVSGCAFWDNSAGEQGAVLASVLASTSCWVEGSAFRDNVARYGGALSLGLDDEWLVSNSSFLENSALVQAGAILADEANAVVVMGSVLRGNTAGTSSAGGILASGDVTLVVTGSEIVGNVAGSQGGGLAIVSGSAYLSNSTVEECVAHTNGGGLYAEASAYVQLGVIPAPVVSSLQSLFFNMSLNFSQGGARLVANEARSSGGGIYASDSAGARLVNASVSSNEALDSGGGVWVSTGAFLSDTGSTYGWNTALLGGAIYVDDEGQLQLQEAVLSGNSAEADGGGLYTRSDHISMNNILLTSNLALQGGGGGMFADWTTMQAEALRSLRADARIASDNEAKYGPEVATAIYNVTAPVSFASASGARAPTVNVTAQDFYGQVVRSYDSNYAVAAVSADQDCKLSGASVADFSSGIAQFANLQVTCDPGSTANLSFSVVDTDLGTSFDATSDVTLALCAMGQIIQSQECVLCGAGVYTWRNDASLCKDCLEHSTCPEHSGWRIDVDTGYWRLGTFSTRVRWCPASDACQGGTNASDAQCSKGSSGPLCLVCEPDYYSPSNLSKCKPCDSGARWAPILVLAGLLLCVGGAGTWIHFRKHEWIDALAEAYARVSFRVYWKVVFAYIQICTQYHEIFAVSYPSAYTAVSSGLNVANLGFSSLFAPHCYDSSYDYYDTLVIQTAGALGAVLVGAAYYGVRHVLSESVDERKKLWSGAFGWFIFFAYIVFPATSTTVFQAFSCDDDFDGDKAYLKADYSVSCRSQRYQDFVVYAAVMVLVFPVGIIALYGHVLWSHQERICPSLELASGSPAPKILKLHATIKEHETLLPSVSHTPTKASHEGTLSDAKRNLRYEYRSQDTSLAPIAYLFEAYKPELWWMELVECMRRLLMSSVLVFFWPATSTQIIAAIVISVFFLLLYSWLQPYMHDESNKLMNAVLWCALFQLFLSLLLFENLIGSHVFAGILMILAMVVGPLLPLLGALWSGRVSLVQSGDERRNRGVPGIALRVVKTALGVRGSGSDDDVVMQNPLRDTNHNDTDNEL